MSDLVKTIGGDRLGSGQKMNVELHNYFRSTHDLGHVVRTTAGVGILYPVYKKLALNGDTWTIDIKTLIKTMPTIGPSLSGYKYQIDVFSCPIRLYNGLLHNNAVKIGMDMAKVKLPTVSLSSKFDMMNDSILNKSQVNPSSLHSYLGLKGIGAASKAGEIKRSFNAVPFLAYWDIFKNYYANKQEQNAYVIDNHQVLHQGTLGDCTNVQYSTETYTVKLVRRLNYQNNHLTETLYNDCTYLTGETEVIINGVIDTTKPVVVGVSDSPSGDPTSYIQVQLGAAGVNTWHYYIDNGKLRIVNGTGWKYIRSIAVYFINTPSDNISVKSFPLENIDEMRYNILRSTALNNVYNINSFNQLPYSSIFDKDSDGYCLSRYNHQGLALKTYQSDIFNNWLSTEWIEGANGIAEISAVDVSGGLLQMDALNLAQKVYNMLNRIAVSGGTYEDWQEAVYGEQALKRAESPIYCGGCSGYIGFEEVVSTAESGDQPLGSLAGKGSEFDKDGGHVEISVKEPSYIMAIFSLTPLIDYSQGNDFDLTEIQSLNDLHKPALDGIGFEDLLLERAAWWGTYYDFDTATWVKKAGGKLPAWINYMTSVNQNLGEFAAGGSLDWMTLNRNYQAKYNPTTSGINTVEPIVDWTTYINPDKYNYTFADTTLTSQNFWVQIGFNVECRRKISAKQIPNL